MMAEITKKDILTWLGRKRDEVNEQIIHAAPDEQGAWMPELQVINAIAERVQEMTAVEYLEARDEICNRHYRFGDCSPCPFNGAVCLLWRIEREECYRAVEIVKKWKEEQDEGTDRV